VKKKTRNLLDRLKEMKSVVVAFSGGVDSALLLFMAHKALGNNVIAVTADSVIHPAKELDAASKFAEDLGVRHVVFASEEMSLPEFVVNNSDRCYHCKRHLFGLFLKIADELGVEHVIHGVNIDDLRDFRPGLKAARELGVLAPLADTQFNKAEIRGLSRQMGLSTWSKPALPCLATRIPYGNPITEKQLGMIEDAEEILLKLGFNNVRVRHHGTLARIEVDRRRIKALVSRELKTAIVKGFRKIGFEYISLDMEGFLSGKMNRDL
jgi:uncharacterized protein